MEKALALLPTPLTTSLLVQKATRAKEIVIQARPSSTYALKAAKQLVGCFPHARPPEPETYAGAIGATLAKYPAAIVDECVDPRRGLALEREFPPTVKSVADWCEARLAHYQALAKYEAREAKPEREFSDDDRALAKQFLAALAAELKNRATAAILADPHESRMRAAQRLGRQADKLAADQERA